MRYQLKKESRSWYSFMILQIGWNFSYSTYLTYLSQWRLYDLIKTKLTRVSFENMSSLIITNSRSRRKLQSFPVRRRFFLNNSIIFQFYKALIGHRYNEFEIHYFTNSLDFPFFCNFLISDQLPYIRIIVVFQTQSNIYDGASL